MVVDINSSETNDVSVYEDNVKSIGRFRTILPQIITSAIVTILLLEIGFSVSFPAVVISGLTGRNVENNANETLSLTADQTSWLGSISYLSKLFGSASSGWISDAFGRKKAMIIVNIPQICSWYLFYDATTLNELFIANILLGYGSGFLKSPALSYIGEISEASVRGVLVATVSLSTMAGLLIAFLLGNLTAWRNVALICLIIRIIVMIAINIVPESPMWLLMKNRDEAALKSLTWLRGWAPDSMVQIEFETMKRHKSFASSCSACEKAKIDCTHPSPSMSEKLKYLIRQRTLKPLFILVICSVIGFSSGTHHLIPYIVQIFNAYQSPISSNSATVVLGFTGVCGTIICITILKFVGKRRIFLISLTAAFCVNTFLGIYGFVYLPPNVKSFQHTEMLMKTHTTSVIPLILFILLQLFTVGIVLVPFMLLGEMFPAKIRGLVTGITTAILNIFTFVATKSFFDLENWLNLPSAMSIYAVCGIIGFSVAYKILPETEGCTLEDIELHFLDNSKSITDRNIIRNHSNVRVKQSASE